MPSTSNFAIPYPCLTPVVDPTAPGALATATEAGLAAVNALAPPLLQREMVQAVANGASTYNVGVTTATTWLAPAAISNPNGMWNAGSPTLFTLQSSGSFMVTLQVQAAGAPTTFTSLRGAILLNGVEQYWAKLPGTNPVSAAGPAFVVAGPLVAATVGSTITATMLWTGTGGPILSSYAIQICKISDL